MILLLFRQECQPWPPLQKYSNRISVSSIIGNFYFQFAYCRLFIVFQAVSLYFCVHVFVYHFV